MSSKRIIVLILLIGAFVGTLYVISHHQDEYRGPAFVQQIPTNPSQPMAPLAPSPSVSPSELLAYNPSTVQGLPENRKSVFGVKKGRPSPTEEPDEHAISDERINTPAYKVLEDLRTSVNSNTARHPREPGDQTVAGWRREYEVREGTLSRSRPNSGDCGGIWRDESVRRVYEYRTEQTLGVTKEQPRTITILSYPEVKNLKLTDALKDPEFEIKLRTDSQLKIQDNTIESGEYTLKPKLEGVSWYLIFRGARMTSARLPLELRAATHDQEKLSVLIFEWEKTSAIQIHLGREAATGWFERE